MDIQANYRDKTKEELVKLITDIQLKLLEKEYQVQDQANQIQTQANEIKIQAKQIHFLEEQFRLYQLRQFAQKSEKMNPNQLSFFDEAELPKKVEKIEAQEQELQVASYAWKKLAGRKVLPKELPRVPRVYDLPEDEKVCSCGSFLTHIKDEKTEQLEINPATV